MLFIHSTKNKKHSAQNGSIRFGYLLLLLLISTCQINAQTLADYLVEASENNHGLKAKYTEFEASLQQVAQVGSLPNPSLAFGYFIRPIETKTGQQQAKISLSQQFPWFGTLKAKKNIATLTTEVKFQVFIHSKNRLSLQVKNTYYRLNEVHQKIGFQKKNKALLHSYKKIVTRNFSNGKSTMIDVLRIDLLLDESSTNLTVLKDEITALEIKFNRLLSRNDTMKVVIKEPLNLLDFEFSQDSISQHPLVSMLSIKEKISVEKELLAKRQGLPRVGVGLDYLFIKKGQTTLPNDGRDAVMPMINLQIPIFRKQYKSAKKEAQIMQTSYTEAKIEQENELYALSQLAIFNLKSNKQKIKLYDKQIESSRQIIRLLYASYKNSGKDFEEVLRAEQVVLKLKTRKATALTNYYLALAQIHYLSGK